MKNIVCHWCRVEEQAQQDSAAWAIDEDDDEVERVVVLDLLLVMEPKTDLRAAPIPSKLRPVGVWRPPAAELDPLPEPPPLPTPPPPPAPRFLLPLLAT